MGVVVIMAHTLTIEDLQQQANQLIGTLREGQEPVLIEDHGRPVAALVSFADYQRHWPSRQPALPGLVADAEAEIAAAVEEYEDETARVRHLRLFRSQLDHLWEASARRPDEFRQVLILLKAGLEDFEELRDLEPRHLRALQTVTRLLAKPEVTATMRNDAFDHLLINDINTLPKIPNIVELMKQAGI
jgi:prevent-host-death family protein